MRTYRMSVLRVCCCCCVLCVSDSNNIVLLQNSMLNTRFKEHKWRLLYRLCELERNDGFVTQSQHYYNTILIAEGIRRAVFFEHLQNLTCFDQSAVYPHSLILLKNSCTSSVSREQHVDNIEITAECIQNV